MIDLDAERAGQQPWWFTLHAATDERPAVRVKFAPIGRIALRAARRAAGDVCHGMDLPEDENAPLPPELLDAAGDALSESLLMSGIVDWEGVGNAAGDPVPVTVETLTMFLADPLRFERLDDAYVRPFVVRELEKNGLSPSSTGMSTGAMPGRDIADRSAKPIGTDDADPMASDGDAPIASMNPEPTPGSASGT